MAALWQARAGCSMIAAQPVSIATDSTKAKTWILWLVVRRRTIWPMRIAGIMIAAASIPKITRFIVGKLPDRLT